MHANDHSVAGRWVAVLTFGLILGAAVAAEPDLSSPRATFTTFLDAMNEAADGSETAPDRAVACFDLEGYAPAVREQAGPRVARELKNYLDKVERIDLSTLPLEPDGSRWVWRRGDAGLVAVERDEEGRWRFSRDTVESLPTLLRSVRGRGYVDGLVGAGSPKLSGWIRARVPESLQKSVFLLEGWQWLGLIMVAALGVILDRLVRLILAVWLRRWVARARRSVDVEGGRFEQPVGIFVMAAVWLALIRILDLPLGALNVLVLASRFVMAAAGVWAAYRLVDLVAAYFASLASKTDSHVDDLLVPLVRRVLKIVVIAFGLVFVAQNLDVDVSSLLTGLGLGGLAFALAAKDTVENLFGSVTVLVDQPFKIGDWITVDGDVEGTVEELGLRSTRIRTFYNSLITVPNARLVHAAVDNLGQRRYRRISTKIGVQYDTPPDRIDAFCEGIRELIRQHPYTRKDFYLVYLNGFGASSLDILLYCFHETPDWSTELRERHRLFLDIVRLAERLGVEFAFPTQTVHVASTPDRAHETKPVPDGDPAWRSDEAAATRDRGRSEARDIAAAYWGEEIQAPVRFDDPDGMPPRSS